jgi:tetratricopeptide (TPR) repeat protein
MAQNWRTIRVFISSTFRDMHAERDHLVKVVFPELRERCAERQLYLVDVDLRWGVTEEEAEKGKVLGVILDEIERSRPFFVAILGERYGFVPDRIPEDVQFSQPWLREYPRHSLTALEIMYGVLRRPEMAGRSFFYLRDPSFISQLSESIRAGFSAENSKAADNLRTLKEKIRASGRPVMENYPCNWDDALGHLVGLDSFGQHVLEDLWTAICLEYPAEVPPSDPVTVERQMHEAFAEERCRFHVGRKEQAARLDQYVTGTDSRPVVITGESGCGKSAFLANWYRRYTAEHVDDSVLAYFIGATPDSANYYRLLRNMCQEVKRAFIFAEEIPNDDSKLSETLGTLLASASQRGGRIVVVVDALDQLLPLEGAHAMGWLLNYVPERVRLVVSSLEGESLKVLRRHGAEDITLPPLTQDEQRQLVQSLLGEWGRKLDSRQMAAFLAHPGARNPLYLSVAFEELRLFGEFEELTNRIGSLAEDIPTLFSQVLARLETDYGKETVAEAFALIGYSRYGLREAELLQLLRSGQQEQFPRVLWSRLARGARMYLVERGELVGFFHRQLAEAVASRYADKVKYHSRLAGYFAQAPVERKAAEYVYQLQGSQKWDDLGSVLGDLELLEYTIDHGRKYEWVELWHSLKGHSASRPNYIALLKSAEEDGRSGEHLPQLCEKVGLFLRDVAEYSGAVRVSRYALDLNKGILQSANPSLPSARLNDHPDLADSLLNVALLYREQGEYAKSIPYENRAAKAFGRKLSALSPDDPRSDTVFHSLGDLLTWRGANLALALQFYERSLALRERDLGPWNPKVAECLYDMARAREKMSFRFSSEQVLLLERALAICERNYGPTHPILVKYLNRIAWLELNFRDETGQRRAVALLERAVDIAERAFGPDHPQTAEIQLNIADARTRLDGETDDLLHLAEHAVKTKEHAMSHGHGDLSVDYITLMRMHQFRDPKKTAFYLARGLSSVVKGNAESIWRTPMMWIPPLAFVVPGIVLLLTLDSLWGLLLGSAFVIVAVFLSRHFWRLYWWSVVLDLLGVLALLALVFIAIPSVEIIRATIRVMRPVVGAVMRVRK